ncbi:MAG: 30S ribosomal protein S3 [Bacteroidia bacterium]|nr:30S ribosomal protein S3 [Bacteroidia bacterium]
MGQKTHPIGLRLGIVKGWDSNWYGGKDFSEKLIEDEQIRAYLNARIPRGGIAKIVIERTLRKITITIHTSRPGIVIGKGGKEVDKLREEIKKVTLKDVQINIFEIKRPELDAALVGQQIAQQLEGRVSFRRAMKSSLAATMRAGAAGCKIMVAGRLGGAEMARTEQYKQGRIPLQTLRADIDYALVEAKTIYGVIGVKVWIFTKELYGKVDLSPDVQAERNKRAPGPGGDRERGERGDRGGDRGGRGNQGGGGAGAGGAGGDRNRGKRNNNPRGGRS